MSEHTSIQWADSSLNLQMGCDGCELWSPARRSCYAGLSTLRHGGRKGWPVRFEEPVLFLDRLAPALKWRDLTGAERALKPWLDGLPRVVFLNDMGDTFSKKLALGWMAPLLPLMAASPHQFLLLTKRPSRAVEFSQAHPFPDNFWIGTSVTSKATLGRIDQLRKIRGGRLTFVSFEPLLEEMPMEAFAGIGWAILGGESGEEARPCYLDWLLHNLNHCQALGTPVFVKQLGAKPKFYAKLTEGEAPVSVPFSTDDSHGGEWADWPMPLRVREMPHIPVTTQAALL